MFEVIWLRQAMESLDNLFVAWDEPTQARMVTVVKEFNRRLSASPLEEGDCLRS